MIRRYTRPEMRSIWDDKKKFLNWVRVEVVVLRAKVKLGLLKVFVPEQLETSIEIVVEEIDRIEREHTKHDVVAFLQFTSAQLPEELRPYWHERLTSYDVQDTALSLQLVASVKLLLHDVDAVMEALKEKSCAYKYAPMVGRTHNVHAEPITFGVKLARWYAQMARHHTRLALLLSRVAVGKLSGAVGMFTLPPAVERVTCEMLELEPIIASQIIDRDIIAEYICTIALIGGSLQKFCVDARLMQGTEVNEAQEFFDSNQKGSSAMPHKRNPIGFENITGHSRTLRGYAVTALENQETWHERDIANSGPERVILPDASLLLDFMLARFANTIKKWIIHPENMLRNLELTKGLIFSESVLSLLAERLEMPRQEAYQIVYEIAQDCLVTKQPFLEALVLDERIGGTTGPFRGQFSDLRECFNLDHHLKYVDYIFDRVFG